MWPHLPHRQTPERATAQASWIGPGRHPVARICGTWGPRELAVGRALVEFPFDDRAALAVAIPVDVSWTPITGEVPCRP